MTLEVIEAMGWTLWEYLDQPDDFIAELETKIHKRNAMANRKTKKVGKK